MSTSTNPTPILSDGRPIHPPPGMNTPQVWADYLDACYEQAGRGASARSYGTTTYRDCCALGVICWANKTEPNLAYDEQTQMSSIYAQAAAFTQRTPEEMDALEDGFMCLSVEQYETRIDHSPAHVHWAIEAGWLAIQKYNPDVLVNDADYDID